MKEKSPQTRTSVLLRLRWVLALLILLLLFLTLSQFNAGSLLHSVKQLSPWPVALLLLLQIFSQLLVNLQWFQVAKFIKVPVSFREMFYINCQGGVIDSITPGVKIGGEITRSVQISRTVNCSGEQAATVVAMQKLFSLSAFFLINLFALGYITGRAAFLDTLLLQIAVYGILILFLLFFSCLFFIPQRMKEYIQRKSEHKFLWVLRVRNFLLTLLDQITAIKRNTKICIKLFLLSFLIWLIYPVKMYLAAMQFIPNVDIIFIGAITYASYMVAMLPVFPGGLGGFEGTMSGLLLTMGFIQSDAFIITVLFRFVTFWFVMLFSILFIGYYKIKYLKNDIAFFARLK